MSDSPIKTLFMGESGCLAGDTVVSVYRGKSTGKKASLEELFGRYMRNRGNRNSIVTKLLGDIDGHTGLITMEKVVRSGVKQVFTLKAADKSIRATADHMFLAEIGWLPLSSLNVGDRVKIWREYGPKLESRRVSTIPSTAKRITIYSVP